jgi:hypothetical protein
MLGVEVTPSWEANLARSLALVVRRPGLGSTWVGQELVDRVVGDASEDVARIGLGLRPLGRRHVFTWVNDLRLVPGDGTA